MAVLTQPLVVAGPIQNRSQAETGMDLWNLSLQQELTIDDGTARMGDIMSYVRDLARRAKEANLPACTFWKRLKNDPCYRGGK